MGRRLSCFRMSVRHVNRCFLQQLTHAAARLVTDTLWALADVFLKPNVNPTAFFVAFIPPAYLCESALVYPMNTALN